jgi:hypothetical protein
MLTTLAMLACALNAPARADSITGTSTTGNNVITGPDIVSTNSGSVTATGTFSGPSYISGGNSNAIGVTATGASALVSIVHEGGNPDASGSDSIVVGTITATNSGAITATGTFNGVSLDGGINNSAVVSAAGTSVTISIVHR